MPRKKSEAQPKNTTTNGITPNDISPTADLQGKMRLCKGKSGEVFKTRPRHKIDNNFTEIVHFLNPQMSYDELRLVTWTEGLDIKAGMVLLHTICARSEFPDQKTSTYTMLGVSHACDSTEKAVHDLLSILQHRAGDFMPGILAAAPLGMPARVTYHDIQQGFLPK